MYVEPVLFLLSAHFYFELWGWCACGVVEGRLWVVVPAVAHGSGCGSLRERDGYGGRARDFSFCPLVLAIDEDGKVVELVALDLGHQRENALVDMEGIGDQLGAHAAA